MLPWLLLIFNLFPMESWAQNYCLWGKQGASHIIVNGEYTLSTTVNNQPSYIKTAGPDCSKPTLYLYRTAAGNAWRVSETLDSDGYVMQCSKSSLSECTAGNWDSPDLDVYALSGSCPEWQCGSITTTQTHYACNGPFDQYIGHNAWKHSTEDLYFYFVPHLFQWACYKALDQINCPTYLYTHTEEGWTDLSTGQSTTEIFTWLQSGSKLSAPFEVNCLDAHPTEKPAPNPVNTAVETPDTTTTTTTTTISPKNDPKTTTTTGSSAKKTTTTVETAAKAAVTTTTKVLDAVSPKTGATTTTTATANEGVGKDVGSGDVSRSGLHSVSIFIGIFIGFTICCVILCVVKYCWYLRMSKEMAESVADEDPDEVDMFEKDEVLLWLEEIGFSQYYATFMNNGFDSMERIQGIDDRNVLDRIGIKLLGHQAQIWSKIQEFRLEYVYQIQNQI